VSVASQYCCNRVGQVPGGAGWWLGADCQAAFRRVVVGGLAQAESLRRPALVGDRALGVWCRAAVAMRATCCSVERLCRVRLAQMIFRRHDSDVTLTLFRSSTPARTAPASGVWILLVRRHAASFAIHENVTRFPLGLLQILLGSDYKLLAVILIQRSSGGLSCESGAIQWSGIVGGPSWLAP